MTLLALILATALAASLTENAFLTRQATELRRERDRARAALNLLRGNR